MGALEVLVNVKEIFKRRRKKGRGERRRKRILLMRGFFAQPRFSVSILKPCSPVGGDCALM